MAVNKSFPITEGMPVPGCAAPFAATCRWIISLDFDGTLFLPESIPTINPLFFEIMESWRPLGVRWGINTGRSLPYLCQDYLHQAPFLPDFLCTCERYVYMADKNGLLLPLETHNTRCVEESLRLRQQLAPSFHAELRSLALQHPLLCWDLSTEDPLSVEAQDSPTMDAIMEILAPFLASLQGVSAQRAGRYMRLAPSLFHKGTALEKVASAWKVPENRLLLVGDGHNDVDAFRYFPAAFCAAPACAHADVQAYLHERAGYVSPSCGVVDILQAWHRLFLCPEQRKLCPETAFDLTF